MLFLAAVVSFSSPSFSAPPSGQVTPMKAIYLSTVYVVIALFLKGDDFNGKRHKKDLCRTCHIPPQMRTAEHVTLLVYKDSRGTYELLDDREVEHEQLAGTDDYILDESGKRNRQLVKGGFQCDNLMGENEFQRFIN